MGGKQRKKSSLYLIIANCQFNCRFVVCITAYPKSNILWARRQGFLYLTIELDDKRKYRKPF